MKTRSGKKVSYAQVVGSPGEKPRFAGFIRAIWPLMILLFAGGYLVRAALPVPELNRMQTGMFLFLLCGVLAYFILWSEKRLADFVKGARGEETVARILALLPSDYRVIHGLNLPGRHAVDLSDYDHVVIGPSGVFVVETKNWSGRITVEHGKVLYDGQEPTRSPIDQVKSAALALERTLKEACEADIHVQPLLCFAGENFSKGIAGMSGVVICVPKTLLEVIGEMEEQMPDAIRERVASYLIDKWE